MAEQRNGADEASLPPSTSQDFLTVARRFDFVHLVLPDIHGHPQTTVLPADTAASLVTQGVDLPMTGLAHTIDGKLANISDHASFGDILLRPVVDSTRVLPWLRRDNGPRVLQVIAQPEWLTGDAIGADPRGMALFQLQRLRSRGLDILWGTECEFRLFEAHSGPSGSLHPAFTSLGMNSAYLGPQFHSMFVELDRRLHAVGSRMERFRPEQELGQIRASLAADWGIKAADHLFRFRMIARDVAHERNLKTSFMTNPLSEQTGNGFLFNHSVWRKEGDTATDNVLYDSNDVNKLSNFARRWLAGLLHHSAALTAICCPTVNCYRRLHSHRGPRYASWGSESGTSSVNVKLRDEQHLTVLESRLPSSAVNPYLMLAGIVAAGLDGVDRELDLVDEGSKEMGALPKTLSHALEALRKDVVMCLALGEQFVEWFLIVKLEEIGRLKTDDVGKADLEGERKLYFGNA